MATKVGLKRCFYIQQLAFRAVGVEINSAEGIFVRPILSGILGVLSILVLASWIDGIWRYESKNLNELTEALLPILQACMMSYKICTFILYHKNVVDLVQRIWRTTEKVSSEECLILLDENHSVRKFSVFYFVSVLTAFVITWILPHFVSISVYVKTGNLRFLTPVQISTPFDQSKPLYYLITTLWYAGGMYFVCIFLMALDTLFVWFVFNIVAQFRIVQHSFGNAASVLDPTEMEIAIRRCIKKHQDTIDLANDLDNIFRQIMFIEFSITGLRTCLIIYKLTGGVPLDKFLYLTVFLVVMIFQCMIYCYGGQRISDESLKIGIHIYDVFPWHTVSVKNRKLLLLSLLRAQKQCEITGIFFVADWKLFLWVIRTTYSMTALFLSFGDDVTN